MPNGNDDKDISNIIADAPGEILGTLAGAVGAAVGIKTEGSSGQSLESLYKEYAKTSLELSVAQDIQPSKKDSNEEKGEEKGVLSKVVDTVIGYLTGKTQRREKLDKVKPGAAEKMDGMTEEGLKSHISNLERRLSEIEAAIRKAEEKDRKNKDQRNNSQSNSSSKSSESKKENSVGGIEKALAGINLSSLKEVDLKTDPPGESPSADLTKDGNEKKEGGTQGR